jgi:hypothetical protein
VPGSRLATTRVLGARVTVGGDPARTWPRPGETALARWIMAGPRSRPLAWSFAVVACSAALDDDRCRAEGTPIPSAAPDPGSGSSDGTTPPTLSVTAPLDAADRLIVTGVICAGGAVADPAAEAWRRCEIAASDGRGSVDETDVQLTIRVQVGDSGNAPPSLDDDAITLDSAGWSSGVGDPSLPASGVPCADDTAQPRVTRVDDQTHEVVVTTDAADREGIPPAPGGPASPGREAAQVSAFATLGSFQTQFRTVLAEDERETTPLAFKWTPPSETDAALDAEGRLVLFVFVLRDGRGGLDVTTRTLCLVQPAAR